MPLRTTSWAGASGRGGDVSARPAVRVLDTVGPQRRRLCGWSDRYTITPRRLSGTARRKTTSRPSPRRSINP